MKNLNKFYLTLAATAMVGFTSCDSDDDKVNAGGNSNSGGAKQYFNVVVGISVETSNTETYAGAFGDISSQDMGIVYENWGFLVPSVRTAYVYTSTAGDYMYSLSYGGGTISKHRVLGGQYYDEVGKLDVSLAMGTNNPRWTKINDDYASLHNVVTTAATDAGFVQANARLTAIDLPNFEIITTYAPEGGVTVEFPVTEEIGRAHV